MSDKMHYIAIKQMRVRQPNLDAQHPSATPEVSPFSGGARFSTTWPLPTKPHVFVSVP